MRYPSDYEVGSDDLMRRSFDGRMTESYLPDMTKVYGYRLNYIKI